MTGRKLSDGEHIIRYVPFSKLRRDEDDNVIGVLGAAFKMRPVDDYLSVTSLEYFAGRRQEQVVSAVHAIRASDLEVKSKGGFAIGNVGRICEVCSTCAGRYKLRVLHEPENDNKAHVAVRRFPKEDDELFELLASDAWSEVVKNSDVEAGVRAAPDDPAWEV